MWGLNLKWILLNKNYTENMTLLSLFIYNGESEMGMLHYFYVVRCGKEWNMWGMKYVNNYQVLPDLSSRCYSRGNISNPWLLVIF